MKKTLSILFLFILSISLYAQKDVTEFLGIPVDGSKSEMMKKLKEKGFIVNPYNKDALIGEFNGTDVNVFVGTNNNKVYRIMVADANTRNETDIKIRFNALCHQFENNKKYLSPEPDQTLTDAEKISYEMMVNKKRYEAVFYQVVKDIHSVNALEESLNKSVWFMIVEESYGKYFIAMFYENKYNEANGQDL